MDTLGKYALEAVLGRGAMGVVYRARDRDIDQVVAIKTMRRDTLEDLDDGSLLQRFKQEALAGRRLKHPNLVGIYDYGELDETYFIVMEYVQGKRLREYFRENHRFEAEEVLHIMEQLLDGLYYAHTHGVIHRDVNPANLLIDDKGNLIIMDFGIARLDTSSLTRTGTVLGTPAYMSPEQCLGQPVDERSDLFSAGVILYQLLSGERPFAGSTAMATMQQVLNLTPVLPSLLNVYFPAGVDHVIQKALAKRPEARFRSAREFSVALKALRGPGAAPAPLSAMDSGIAAATLPALLPRLLPVTTGRAPRPPWYGDIARAVLVGFAAVILVWYLAYSIAPLVRAVSDAFYPSLQPGAPQFAAPAADTNTAAQQLREVLPAETTLSTTAFAPTGTTTHSTP